MQVGRSLETSSTEANASDQDEADKSGEPIMTLAEYLRDARTLDQAEVDHRTAVHDSQDLRPEERASFDTGSMHRLEIQR